MHSDTAARSSGWEARRRSLSSMHAARDAQQRVARRQLLRLAKAGGQLMKARISINDAVNGACSHGIAPRGRAGGCTAPVSRRSGAPALARRPGSRAVPWRYRSGSWGPCARDETSRPGTSSGNHSGAPRGKGTAAAAAQPWLDACRGPGGAGTFVASGGREAGLAPGASAPAGQLAVLLPGVLYKLLIIKLQSRTGPTAAAPCKPLPLLMATCWHPCARSKTNRACFTLLQVAAARAHPAAC